MSPTVDMKKRAKYTECSNKRVPMSNLVLETREKARFNMLCFLLSSAGCFKQTVVSMLVLHMYATSENGIKSLILWGSQWLCLFDHGPTSTQSISDQESGQPQMYEGLSEETERFQGNPWWCTSNRRFFCLSIHKHLE